jgi:hypothetical protein
LSKPAGDGTTSETPEATSQVDANQSEAEARRRLDVDLNVGEDGVRVDVGGDGVNVDVGQEGVKVDVGDNGVGVDVGQDEVGVEVGEPPATKRRPRDDYVAEMKVKLDVWNAAIDELEAKARKRQAQAAEDFTAQVNELKSKRDAATDKLQEIQNASKDAWEHLETGVERIWDDMKRTFEETSKALS